jgi:hypothetical protein
MVRIIGPKKTNRYIQWVIISPVRKNDVFGQYTSERHQRLVCLLPKGGLGLHTGEGLNWDMRLVGSLLTFLFDGQRKLDIQRESDKSLPLLACMRKQVSLLCRVCVDAF